MIFDRADSSVPEFRPLAPLPQMSNSGRTTLYPAPARRIAVQSP